MSKKSVKNTANFFSTVYAALIVMALGIAYFAYTVIMTTDDVSSVIYEVSDNGTMSVAPSSGLVPSGPPYVAPPTTPPPTN